MVRPEGFSPTLDPSRKKPLYLILFIFKTFIVGASRSPRQTNKTLLKKRGFCLCARRDLNPQLLDPQSNVLSIELRALGSILSFSALSCGNKSINNRANAVDGQDSGFG